MKDNIYKFNYHVKNHNSHLRRLSEGYEIIHNIHNEAEGKVWINQKGNNKGQVARLTQLSLVSQLLNSPRLAGRFHKLNKYFSLNDTQMLLVAYL